MKKSIFLISMLCFLINVTYSQNPTGGGGGGGWGIPSKECRGNSVCEITHEPKGSFNGNFSYDFENGTLLMQVKKTETREDLFYQKNETLYFRQVEPILVDPILCRKIGAMATLQVQKGNFLVTESKDGSKYIIHLIVKELD